jgi:hypothetical protein
MKRLLLAMMLSTVMPFSQNAAADPLTVGHDDTMEKILAGQMGKKVTLRTGNNEELTGTVKTVTPQVVHLGELTGKEFFDAVVATKSITAVIVRVK